MEKYFSIVIIKHTQNCISLLTLFPLSLVNVAQSHLTVDSQGQALLPSGCAVKLLSYNENGQYPLKF